MFKNLRLVAPVALVLAAGTVASADARLVVRNDSARPWRLRCLQDVPAFTLHRRPAGAGSPTAESKAPRLLDEIRIGSHEQIELQWTDLDVPGRTLRFAFLDEAMLEPEGTIVAFTWDWKGEGQGEARLLHPQAGADARYARCQDAISASSNTCTITRGCFGGPGNQPGAGAGSGAGAPAAERLPRGAGEPGPDVAWGLEPRPAGAGAGAGAGSQSSLPGGPSAERVLERFEYEMKHGIRKPEVRPEPKAPLESRLYVAAGHLQVRQAEVQNNSHHPFDLAVTGAAEGSTYRQTGPDRTTTGDLGEVLRLPAKSRTTLTLVGESPLRPAVQVDEAERTPTRATRYGWRPLGATPSRDGRSPFKLYQVTDPGTDAASLTVVRTGGDGVLVIEDRDDKVAARLDDAFASMFLYAASPDRDRHRAGAPQSPDAAPPATAGAAVAQAGAGAPAAVESKAPAAQPAAGARGPLADTEFLEPGACTGDFPLGLEYAPVLDLEKVVGDETEAVDAVYGWLLQHAQSWEAFNQVSREYVQRVVETAAKAGHRDLKEAMTAGLGQVPEIQELDRKYTEEGHRALLALLEASEAEWMTHGKLPKGWTIQLLRERLVKISRAWLKGRVRDHARISLDLVADAALEPGAAGPGAAAGAGAPTT